MILKPNSYEFEMLFYLLKRNISPLERKLNEKSLTVHTLELGQIG